ncbi:manganese efflux pump MntP family protein [Chloroflexota bacterium]
MSELGILSILFIALGLSADCFAVALSGSVSMGSVSLIQKLRTSLTFGFFQALMPVLGWLAGRTVVNLIADYDHWVAFSLLAFIGIKMIWESTRNKENHNKIDITRGFILLTLAVATSIDALAVGLTFAFLEVSIALASSVIGIVAFIVTMLSFAIGRKAGELIGKRAETIGGVILIIIGLRVLLTHIF